MNINDLKIGYLVKFRGEGFGVVADSNLGKIIIYDDYSSDSIEDWHDDLTDSLSRNFDIIEIYKPKNEAHILSTLDDYELIWKEENLDAHAFKVCSALEKKYKGHITYKKIDKDNYKFNFFNCHGLSASFNITISGYLVEELVRCLSRLIENAIISHYKKDK